MGSLMDDIDRIESNIRTVSRLHEKALVAVSQDEINRINRKLDSMQDETTELMNSVRLVLRSVADETKRAGGREQESRKAQQSRVALRLQRAAQMYSQVQQSAKEQYKKRMEREIKIGNKF